MRRDGALLLLLVCGFFCTPAPAADVAFSDDNQRIYAVATTDDSTKPALREIDLSTNTSRIIPLVELNDLWVPITSHTLDVASADPGKILVVSEKDLWAFDLQSSRLAKLCSAPSGSRFLGVASDPKGHAVYVWTDKDALFMVKNDRELVPIKMQGSDQVACLVFSSEGKLFYEQSGDLWSGEIKSNGDSLQVEVERYALGRQLSRTAESPEGQDYPIVNLAEALDGIYVQLWHYHNRGRGFGALLKLPPRAQNAEAQTHSRNRQLAAKKLEDTDRPVLLGASRDGSRVYYTNDDREYLVTNGRTQKLQLREADQKAGSGTSNSDAANSSDATEQPPSSPPVSSDGLAAVAEREIAAISAQNIDALTSFYADEVDLLDKGVVSRETARKDWQQYFDRWPVTKWKLTGRINVKPLEGSKYEVSFPVTFEVGNPASNRAIVGTATESRIVALDAAGVARIIQQRERITKSRAIKNSSNQNR